MRCIDSKEVKTRKDHQCFGCLEIIPVGTTMNRSTFASDNDGIWTNYQCAECDQYLIDNPDLNHEFKFYGVEEGFIYEHKQEESQDAPEK